MNEAELREARDLLERYSERDSHQIFNLKQHIDPSQCWYEGYIYEVKNEVIVFGWAPSPFDESDNAWQELHEISIQDIDLSSLLW